MTNLLKSGSAWLEQKRTDFCSSRVTYFVGAEEKLVDATFGRTEFEFSADGEQTVVSHVWDFLILTVDLVVAPAPGHFIVTGGLKYEVMPFGPDRNGWRWSDPFRQTYRVHTRCVGAAA